MAEIRDEHGLSDSGLEPIESEEEDLDASPPRYEIVTYPADYTLEVLFQKYKKGQIILPGFQRKFVWRLPQASKLIESFLLGLPVPAVFLYADPTDNKLLVIDGQQRLLSIVYYFEGFFGGEQHGKRTVFSLKGLNEQSPYLGKTYEALRESDEPAYNRLNDAVLRAFVVKQLNPSDHTSIYHIFERLNTGGTQLVSQEIRNCIYHGRFNDLLCELNAETSWRTVFGKPLPDKRQRDIELILRFFALLYDVSDYEKPMKDFLSVFMNSHQNDPPEKLAEYRRIFVDTMSTLQEVLGTKPFHIKTGLNAAVFDSVSSAFGANLERLPHDIRERYQALVQDREFLALVSSNTTDNEVVTTRLAMARERLFLA